MHHQRKCPAADGGFFYILLKINCPDPIELTRSGYCQSFAPDFACNATAVGYPNGLYILRYGKAACRSREIAGAMIQFKALPFARRVFEHSEDIERLRCYPG
jgi:hypothetical protein